MKRQRTMDKATHAQIAVQTDEGNRLFELGEYRDALEKYIAALHLVPDPPEMWEATTWILAGIGDCYFQMGNYEKARQAFSDAVTCPGGLGNPFIHLRLGEAQFELNEMVRAQDELARAYMGAGNAIFADEDPKYWQFIKAAMNLE